MNQTTLTHKTFLIAGATGFIGTNLCLKLLQNGHKIYAIDNHNSSDPQNLNFIKSLGGIKTGSEWIITID